MQKIFKCEKDNILLIEYLSDMLGFLSINKIKNQLKIKEVKVNGKRTNENLLLKSGDEVHIFLPQSFKQSEQNVEIVYEDKNILVVDKPVLCDVENHLLSILSPKYNNIQAVHRLDRNTTGLVIFALNANAYKQLIAVFKNRTIKKFYLAEVAGHVEPKKALIKAYLKKDSQKSLCTVSQTKESGYSEILTEYEVIEYRETTTLLRVQLHTGRTHQIRAHLKFIGHPIIGDGKYGDNIMNKEFNAKYQRLRAEKIVLDGFTGELSYLNGKVFIAKNIDEFWNLIYNGN